MTLNFKKTHVIQATYRIVTPMFIGDAEQKATGISPASVKGALRFWWRALMWGEIRSGLADDASALKCLHCQEGTLFGSSADNGNAARFTLIVKQNVKPNKVKVSNLTGYGLSYFLGIGLSRDSNRDAIALGESFIIQLALDHKTTELEKQSLINALLAIGLLGGLGSRARKGFGSIAIESLMSGEETIEIPRNIEELKNTIRSWKCNLGLPPFTAFSEKTRIDISMQGKDSLDILNKTGEEQQLYRSYGQKGKVRKNDAEKNFIPDHNLVLDIIRNKKSNTGIPKRSVFGLPHNYFFSSEFNKIKDKAIADGESEQAANKKAARESKADFAPSTQNRTRRASPLFIHVHQFPDKKIAVIQTLIPAMFLLQGDPLEFKVGSSVKVDFNEQTMIDWQVIHTYMDRFKEKVRVL